jgi:preprotein translocase subunit SecE
VSVKSAKIASGKEKGNAAGNGGFLAELLRTGLYKRQQGRIARQVTFAAFAVAVVLGAYRLGQTIGFMEAFFAVAGGNNPMSAATMAYSIGLPLFILVGGLWASYRAVNMPRFADFLISVEAEMNKVSWPSRGELYRSSMVVLFTVFFMAAVLFAFDFVWNSIFQALGVSG